jgi:hypothetical protein
VDPQTAQRVTLLENLAVEWAFSVESDDLDRSVAALEKAGAVVRHRESFDHGFSYALVCVNDTFPLCVWHTA